MVINLDNLTKKEKEEIKKILNVKRLTTKRVIENLGIIPEKIKSKILTNDVYNNEKNENRRNEGIIKMNMKNNKKDKKEWKIKIISNKKRKEIVIDTNKNREVYNILQEILDIFVDYHKYSGKNITLLFSIKEYSYVINLNDFTEEEIIKLSKVLKKMVDNYINQKVIPLMKMLNRKIPNKIIIDLN